MNCSFVEGGFPPELLKQTIVKPLHTMGDADSLGNNRPISLLTSFAKIFELVLSMRLFHFFRKLYVIADSQHGFSKGKNTETAIFEFIRKISDAMEKGDTLSLFIDLSKAFDSVDQIRLISKLENCGIRHIQLNLNEDYLKGRFQRTLERPLNQIIGWWSRECLKEVYWDPFLTLFI